MEELVFNILEEISGEDLRGEGDVSLFDSGTLDSLGIIELIVSIEEKTKISLDPGMLDRKDIETPNKIIKYLEALKEG